MVTKFLPVTSLIKIIINYQRKGVLSPSKFGRLLMERARLTLNSKGSVLALLSPFSENFISSDTI